MHPTTLAQTAHELALETVNRRLRWMAWTGWLPRGARARSNWHFQHLNLLELQGLLKKRLEELKDRQGPRKRVREGGDTPPLESPHAPGA